VIVVKDSATAMSEAEQIQVARGQQFPASGK
jgi:hypothetical protein